jgi:hypothetical protein
LLRIEGDFEYWRTSSGAEYRRWAEGNSQGKAAHAFRDRHPGTDSARRRNGAAVVREAADRLEALVSRGPRAILKAADRIARADAAQQAAGDGLVRAVRSEGHRVRDVLDAWGVLVGRQAVRAMSGSPQAVSAVRFVGEATGILSAGGEAAPIQAVQVNVSIGGELTDRYAPRAVLTLEPAEPEAGPTSNGSSSPAATAPGSGEAGPSFSAPAPAAGSLPDR